MLVRADGTQVGPRKGGRIRVESVARLPSNRWPLWRGIGGRFGVELVATLPWNTQAAEKWERCAVDGTELQGLVCRTGGRTWFQDREPGVARPDRAGAAARGRCDDRRAHANDRASRGRGRADLAPAGAAHASEGGAAGLGPVCKARSRRKSSNGT